MYQSTLEKCSTVLEFEEFGDYQGTWYAIIEHDGKTELVSGSYGSCSGCDAFESEFGWGDDNKSDYEERLKQFGMQYLDQDLNISKEIEDAINDYKWDSYAKDKAQTLKEWKEKYFDK